MLDDPNQSAQLKNWLKTLRKKNTAVVFATQSLEDLLESSIRATLMQSCLTKIYLANSEAVSDVNVQAYRAFGLTDWQIRMISKAQEKRDYYVVQPGGRRMISLDLNNAALAFLGVSDQKDIRKVRALIDEDRTEMEEAGTPEVAWWPAKWLAHRAGDGWAQLWVEGPRREIDRQPIARETTQDAQRGVAHVA
jgi:type IV secretory pathway VirB4 component